MPWPWQKYLDHLQERGPLSSKGCTDLGAFALVDDHRREIENLTMKPENDDEDETEGTKLAPRNYNLRDRDPKVSYKDLSDSSSSRPGTREEAVSSHAPKTPSRSIMGLTKQMAEYKINEYGTPVKQFPLDNGEEEWLPVMVFPRARDEQIVNTALIDLVKAITLYLPYYARWTLLRKAFYYDDWEARVDGCLESYTTEDDDTPVKAIVEVKACRRKFSPLRIRMQEGAQMAAWIATDMAELGCKILEDGRRRRVLVSQDRDEIYATFALYDKEYVEYLIEAQEENKQKRPDGEKKEKRKQKDRREDQAVQMQKDENEQAKPEWLRSRTSKVKGAIKTMTGKLGKGRGGRVEEGKQDESLHFLEMFEIGPLNVNNSNEMSFFGRFISLIVADTCSGAEPGLGNLPTSSGSSLLHQKQSQRPAAGDKPGPYTGAARGQKQRPAQHPHPSSSSDHRQAQSTHQYSTPQYEPRQHSDTRRQFDTRATFDEYSRYDEAPQSRQRSQFQQSSQSEQHLRYEQPGNLSQHQHYSRSNYGTHSRHEPLQQVPPQFAPSPLRYQATPPPVVPSSYPRASDQATSYPTSYDPRAASSHQRPPIYV
jgi:hypothetical protein